MSRDTQAEYLLMHLPILWERASQGIDNALHGGNRDLSANNRRSDGGHADTTGRRAIALAEANELARQLAMVRQWIDSRLQPGDRAFLLATWRTYRFGGWPMVAREIGWEASEYRQRWDALVTELIAFSRH